MARGEVNQNVRNNYPHYVEVVSGIKISPSPITLQRGASNNTQWLGAEVGLQHSSVEHEIRFVAEKSIKCASSFKFKLRALHLAREPVFRFDSDGPTHRNRLEEIPLPEQQVTTPHFHKFNEQGINIAYKTDALKIPAQVEAIIADVNFGLAHFSSETSLRDNNGARPQLQEELTLIPLPANDDPLADVNF